jgi:outer membrane protein TolC
MKPEKRDAAVDRTTVRTIPTALAALVACGWSAPLTLSEAMARLENGNNGLKAQSQKVVTASETRKAAFGNFLPVVKLESNVMVLDREIELDLDPIRTAIIQLQAGDAVNFQKLQYSMTNSGATMPAANQLAVKNAATAQLEAGLPHFVETVKDRKDWDASIVAYQPLFHGGRILAGYRVAQAREQAAASDLDRQKNDLRKDFAKLYLQGSLLRSSIALRNQSIKAIEHHRDLAKNMVEQGMVDRAASLRAEMALADARTALSDDSMKLESISITLAQMAGQDEAIAPADSMPPPPLTESVTNAAGAGGAAENPMIRSLAANQEVARRAVQAKTADFAPEIGAFGKYEFNQDAAKMALEPCWVVGVKGTINLFHGGGDWHARAAARSTEMELAALRAEAENALGAQSKRQFLSLRQARTRFGNLGAQADLARENHRVTTMRFEQGQATSLEVVDAWLAMQKSDLDRLAAAGDGWMAAQEILWASGRTDAFATLWNGARK